MTERPAPARPRNQLGQPATQTPAEAADRLTEKLSKNHGGGNRARIRAQISEEQALQAIWAGWAG